MNNDAEQHIEDIIEKQKAKRAAELEETFSTIAVCHICGAVVFHREQHLTFHKAINTAFEERDRVMKKAFRGNRKIDDEGERP